MKKEIKSALHVAALRFPNLANYFKPFMIKFFNFLKNTDINSFKKRNTYIVDFSNEIDNDLSVERFLKAANGEDCVGIGTKASGRNVLMLVVSDLRIDPRVEREARALAEAGYQISVLCPDPTQGGVLPVIDWGPNVQIEFIHWSAASFLNGRPGTIANKIFDAAMVASERLKPFAIHAHDLNTCYAGLAVARTTGSHLVADFHEWTSENVHWDYPTASWKPYEGEWKAELQALESRIMREASAVITVCESIIDALAAELGNGRRASLLRNIPSLSAVPTKTYPSLKQQLGLPESQFVLLWQGGTGTTRLIEPIIEALAFAPKCTFVIRGPSLDLFGKDYQAIADRIGAGDRLILQDPVPSRDVVAAARGADAGIWTLPAFCRNFTYALPNKIFEYIAANLPIFVANYPEARRTVETHQVGLTFDPYDPKSIAVAINRLIEDPAFAKTCRNNTASALASLDADREWQKLVTIYNELDQVRFGVSGKKIISNFKKVTTSKTALSILAITALFSIFLFSGKRTETASVPKQIETGVLGQSPDILHPLRLPALTGAQRTAAPYINIPAVVVRPNAAALRPYFALREGLRVKYVGNIFSQSQPELIWVPLVENGRERMFWKTFAEGQGGLVGIFPGDVLTLIDDVIYDMDVGTLFIKVKKQGFPIGYMLLETLIGETELEGDKLIIANDPMKFRKYSSVSNGNILLYEQTVVNDIGELKKYIKIFHEHENYETTLNAGLPGGVHPLFATSTARSMLFTALNPDTPDELRAETVAAVAHFFTNYIEKNQIKMKNNMVSWPYNFEWNMNWGVKLSPPWYSPFANSQIVIISALMYKATGDLNYRKMAHDASIFISKSISDGGSEYNIDGFRFPAEYVYPTPPLPNVRVLDGELGVAISLYNAARIIGDSKMLSDSIAYFASIAMNLEGYLKEDGDLSFAYYFETMPEGYRWPMWALLQNAALITKDRRFTEYASRITKFIGPVQCKSYGC